MKRKRKLGGWWFLALVLLAHVATAWLDPGLADQARAGSWRMLASVAPVLGLIFALMFFVERFLTPECTRAWLGRSAGTRGWLLALAGGVISTGPVYAWYALLAELRAKGMRDALVAVALYARAIKLPLLPLLAHYFGLRYMLVLSLWLALFAILNGLLTERLVHSPGHA